jgi:tetraacyldisaccharide 4'-kinase
VPLDEPTWWYGRPDAVAGRLLAPLALAWALSAERRMRCATPYRSRLPVVCIGNFTAGGTGKTPLTALVAGELARLGRSPVVLSRGYGGRLKGPHWVDLALDTAGDVGDEPLLLAAKVPVVVSSDRERGARAIESRLSSEGVIVMDDGLQNPSLVKDFSIAVVDGSRGLGNGRVMPAGPLRAALPFQLSLVDAIVVNLPPACEGTAPGLVEALRAAFGGPVLVARTSPVQPVGWIAERPVIAWAGIGSPGRFFDTLRTLGAKVLQVQSFPDHHLPTESQARALLSEASRLGADLVTTEKDWVRIQRNTGAAAELAAASRPFPIEVRLQGSDPGRLAALLAAAMAGNDAVRGSGPSA